MMESMQDALSARVSWRCVRKNIVSKECNFLLPKLSGPPEIAEHAVSTA
jgi:hypothetical protein